MLIKQLYIGGELVSSGLTTEVINPATLTPVGSIAAADIAQAEQALAAANKAFPIWSKTSIKQRTDWMYKLRDAVIENEQHLRECIHLEMAKPWSSTKDDYQMLVDSLNFYADAMLNLEQETLEDKEGTHTHELRREPVGVAAAFLAWNFPLLNLAYKIGPAMAAGCPIVIKPSVKTPLSAYAVGELCAKIGLPAGVVNIISGPDHKVGDAISASTIPSVLTLIGSTNVGKHVIATGATSIKRYSMELGGNAPAIVFADADLNNAADVICGVKFANAGQICVTPNRVLVEQSIADEFIEMILTRAHSVKVGFDKTADIDMGPVMDASSWHRIDALVQDAIVKGATLLTGGGKPEGHETGYFYSPTVLCGVTPEMDIAKEEVFGPVISIMTFSKDDEVLAEANNTEAGLSSFIFTTNEARVTRFADELRFAEVQVNGIKYAINLPHFGIKQSGVGVDCSLLALDDYLAYKRVSRAV
ncbi:aldehyde dehydrogenase family protein [Shewanella sp. 1_MG-2023]|jgi:succinate-semialdehyde dehydrogenase/glutarate-semialdehyde dehydrogenase|uniref:aldehyde dehydrogenase family protein n=1 Tax=unclassified Shewanella TaxID=196818 RepID=UPI000C83F5A8|nr:MULTISPECIES: aldehyde dehydrogenase family protein [unclassified Shewanella]MDO6613405.1 aldehyde dehydrogenase family protein [Shewanella sp. 7_MG-2023]MDO6770071.1 aldehyde dehydrogenase family protein [Shewanella sp. 2_MG-2023]MDO6794817.1 aldehyde dehydrogenase family protein [Shewanella sp. 1_MG-2023]PMG78053.1 NAD-dependent succinate-semialdehyde dehydrogenase [Shewanella sp. 10N.286.51.B7]